MGGAAAAVSLLAGIAFSSPATAATFTLAELDAGTGFAIGSLQFSDWMFDDSGSTVDPSVVTVETIESETVPGFVIHGNGELTGELARLDYQYTITTTDGLVVGAGLLWLTESFASADASIDVTLQETQTAALMLEVGVDAGVEDLSDSGVLQTPLGELALRSVVEMDIAGIEGDVAVSSYATLFTIIPEPGTALLMGLGLAGLTVVGRRRGA
jgi:hypothetical protein